MEDTPAVNIPHHLRSVVKEFLPLDKICGIVMMRQLKWLLQDGQPWVYESLVCAAHTVRSIYNFTHARHFRCRLPWNIVA